MGSVSSADGKLNQGYRMDRNDAHVMSLTNVLLDANCQEVSA